MIKENNTFYGMDMTLINTEMIKMAFFAIVIILGVIFMYSGFKSAREGALFTALAATCILFIITILVVIFAFPMLGI